MTAITRRGILLGASAAAVILVSTVAFIAGRDAVDTLITLQFENCEDGFYLFEAAVGMKRPDTDFAL